MSRGSSEAGNVTTVLVVDDDPAARDLLAATLKGTGYRLIHAGSGEEALDLAQNGASGCDYARRDDAQTGWLGSAQRRSRRMPNCATFRSIMVTIMPDRGIGLSLGAVEC